MTRPNLIRVVFFTLAMGVPAAAFAAAAATGATGGCPLSFCAALFGCGG